MILQNLGCRPNEETRRIEEHCFCSLFNLESRQLDMLRSSFTIRPHWVAYTSNMFGPIEETSTMFHSSKTDLTYNTDNCAIGSEFEEQHALH